jgi:HlyD family secretion protein
MSKKVKIGLIVIVALVVVVMVFVNVKKSRGNAIEVTVSKVEKGDITKTVSGSGYVQPEIDVDISARISAEIIKIHVIEGEKVKKGQVLVDLDRQRYAAAVEQYESSLTSAKAELKKADADYVRIKNLFDQNLTTQADLDAAEATRQLAQSRVQQSQAALKQADDDLSKTRLVAPIDGTVTRLLKEEGEIAVGSNFQADPIMTVSELAKMEVLAEVDENDVVLVDTGDKAAIEVDAIPDTSFEGHVREIAHTATTRGRGTQEQVTNFEVKIAFSRPSEKLRPGMSATVDISTETHQNVLFVPIQCVTAREAKSDSTKAASEKKETESSDQQEGRSNSNKKEKKNKQNEVVFVVDNSVAKIAHVKTGISDDNNIEIMSGLEDGQSVVSGSYKALSKLLKDGSQVKIKKEQTFTENKKSD